MKALASILSLCLILSACAWRGGSDAARLKGTYVGNPSYPQCEQLTLYPDTTFVFTHCDEIHGAWKDKYTLKGDTLSFPWVPGIYKLGRLLARGDRLFVLYPNGTTELRPKFKRQSRHPHPAFRP